MSNRSAIVILGDQLLDKHPALEEQPQAPIIMIEADDLCRTFPYHKHKLVLVLSAMREYAKKFNENGREVIYRELQKDSVFKTELSEIIAELEIDQLVWMRHSNHQPNETLEGLAKGAKLKTKIYPNRLFMLGSGEFSEWFDRQKQPLMENFYRWHRKRSGLLMDGEKPVGGEWNYDKQNRRPLPKDGIEIPKTPVIRSTPIVEAVSNQIAKLYPNNPGNIDNFWLPTSRKEALAWLEDFIKNRLELFGDYEDAMKESEATLFHSVLSPLINLGIISPQEAIDKALGALQAGRAPINSVEGFVRQIAGWREYMYGLYQNRPEMMEANFFGFDKQLEDWWYTEEWQNQNLPIPVKHALDTVHKYGYNHHIERLMILGNWFLLNEYNPKSVYRWFSSMYVDAYEWVMVPNVQGMSQYADGGFVATKPYISGGNYLQKMGSFWSSLDEARQSEFNRLYWRFLQKHSDKLRNNPRMSIVLKQAERMKSNRA